MISRPKPWLYHWRPLWQSYRKNNWCEEIENYLKVRYPPIVNRLIDTFRYVDLHPDNKGTFSYEFTSLLRDIGGIFSSVLDSFVKGVWGPPEKKYKKKKEYNIEDYKNFLLDEFENLQEIVVVLNAIFDEKHLIPFKEIKRDKKFNPVWWEAYNKVKHSDIDFLQKGCLSNVIYGFSALTILADSIITLGESYDLGKASRLTRNIIGYIGEVASSVEIKEFPIVEEVE